MTSQHCNRILEGIDERFEIKVLADGVHQLVINDCATVDAGEIKCAAGDVKTTAKLGVNRKEQPPKVDGDGDQEDADGRIKGKYKGKE